MKVPVPALSKMSVVDLSIFWASLFPLFMCSYGYWREIASSAFSSSSCVGGEEHDCLQFTNLTAVKVKVETSMLTSQETVEFKRFFGIFWFRSITDLCEEWNTLEKQKLLVHVHIHQAVVFYRFGGFAGLRLLGFSLAGQTEKRDRESKGALLTCWVSGSLTLQIFVMILGSFVLVALGISWPVLLGVFLNVLVPLRRC